VTVKFNAPGCMLGAPSVTFNIDARRVHPPISHSRHGTPKNSFEDDVPPPTCRQ